MLGGEMPNVSWDETFSVGSPIIDRQHQKLIDLINNLHQVLMEEDRTGRLADAKARTIDALMEYGMQHFETEEEYMQEMNYPELDEHRKEHRIFIENLNRYRAELTTAYEVRTSQVMKIMTDWLRDHLLNQDRKYADFAREGKRRRSC
jgi:hemerythrin